MFEILFVIQVPVTSVYVDGNPALNRVKWTQSGMNLTVGDDTGKIWVYELGEVSFSYLLKMTKHYHNTFLF